MPFVIGVLRNRSRYHAGRHKNGNTCRFEFAAIRRNLRWTTRPSHPREGTSGAHGTQVRLQSSRSHRSRKCTCTPVRERFLLLVDRRNGWKRKSPGDRYFQSISISTSSINSTRELALIKRWEYTALALHIHYHRWPLSRKSWIVWCRL